VNAANLFLERAVLRSLVHVENVGEVLPDHRAVCRDDGHRQLVDFPEFFSLGCRGARHAADPLVHSGETLHCDGAQYAALGLQRQALFGLDGGLQTGGPAAILRNAAFELVDQFHGPILYHVIDIAFEQSMGVQRVLYGRQNSKIALVEQAAAAEGSLHLKDAGIGQLHVAGEFVDVVVCVRPKLDDDRIDAVRERRIIRSSARDDQRDARFVDEDRIRFIDDGEGKWALDDLAGSPGQAVAQVIEAHFVGGRVCHVGTIRGVAWRGEHGLRDVSNRQSEPLINPAHPRRIAAGQVIVSREDMDPATIQRKPHHGGDGGERLAFAGLHFDDVPAHESERAQDLHVEHPQSENSLGDDGRQRERLDQIGAAA